MLLVGHFSACVERAPAKLILAVLPLFCCLFLPLRHLSEPPSIRVEPFGGPRTWTLPNGAVRLPRCAATNTACASRWCLQPRCYGSRAKQPFSINATLFTWPRCAYLLPPHATTLCAHTHTHTLLDGPSAFSSHTPSTFWTPLHLPIFTADALLSLWTHISSHTYPSPALQLPCISHSPYSVIPSMQHLDDRRCRFVTYHTCHCRTWHWRTHTPFICLFSFPFTTMCHASLISLCRHDIMTVMYAAVTTAGADAPPALTVALRRT